MREAILSVTLNVTVDFLSEQPYNRVLYHSRKGLTPDSEHATKFKTLKHALRVARKKYSPRLGFNGDNGRDLKSWTAYEIGG